MCSRIRALAAALVFGGLLLGPLAAGAQSPAPEMRELEYDRQINAALDDYEHHRYEEAKANFEAAHAIQPSARTLRGLGKVEFELRNYGEASKYLGEALRSQVHPLTPALREEVEQLLRRCQLYVGQLHLEVQPDTATVIVDGVKVEGGPQAALSLIVGDHVLELHAVGRMPERRSVKIRGGQDTRLQIILTPTHPEPTPLAQPTEPTEKSKRRKRAWLWTTVSLVAAAVVVGVSVAATRDRSDTETSPPNGLDGHPTDGPIIQALELP